MSQGIESLLGSRLEYTHITLKQGIAMSNLPPINDPVPPPLPLNALADFTADQRFTLTSDEN